MWDISCRYENEKNFHLKYEFRSKHWKLIFKIKELLEREEIFVGDFRLQMKEKGLSFSEIKLKLRQAEFRASDEEIFSVLQFLLITEQSIVRKEYWNKESTYILMDKYYYESSFTRSHFSFDDEVLGEKRFVLLSDTHIGNDGVENFEIINSLYNYGIVNGIKYFFHLGDLFTKNNLKLDSDENVFSEQINRFKERYPNPTPSEISTYSLIGNHDEKVNEFLKENLYSDLRMLTSYNKGFYMIPRTTWEHSFNKLVFHFSHRLYYSCLKYDLKMEGIKDLIQNERWKDYSYNVLISGHLHKGFIYITPNSILKEKDILYLGAPSTSNINSNGVVAYDVYISEDGMIYISLLGVTPNNRIIKIDELQFNSNQKNPEYAKILK